MMNSHSWESASPPAKRAGPRLRAGLTEVPVSGMPTRWITARAMPIGRPSKPTTATLCVTASTTKTSRNVRITSARKAPPRLMCTAERAPQPLLPNVSSVLSPGTVWASQYSSPAPTMPPTSCAIQYSMAVRPVMRRASSMPRVTAGLTWAPETGPSAYATAKRTKPKESAMPRTPM